MSESLFVASATKTLKDYLFSSLTSSNHMAGALTELGLLCMGHENHCSLRLQVQNSISIARIEQLSRYKLVSIKCTAWSFIQALVFSCPASEEPGKFLYE